MKKIISVLANKGGVGKTSITTNIAAVLAERGYKTLIIDTDAQNNVSKTFGVPLQTKTIHGVLTGLYGASEAVLEVAENLYVLPSGKEMSFLEFDVLTKLKKYPKPFDLLKEAIELIQNEYDYIIIDTPPALGLIAGNVLALSNSVIIPFVPEPYAVDGLKRVVESVRDFKQQLNPALEIEGIIGMMIDKRTQLHKALLAQAEGYCVGEGLRVFKQRVFKSIKYPNAVAFERKPLVMVDAKEETFRKIVKEMLV